MSYFCTKIRVYLTKPITHSRWNANSTTHAIAQRHTRIPTNHHQPTGNKEEQLRNSRLRARAVGVAVLLGTGSRFHFVDSRSDILCSGDFPYPSGIGHRRNRNFVHRYHNTADILWRTDRPGKHVVTTGIVKRPHVPSLQCKNKKKRSVKISNFDTPPSLEIHTCGNNQRISSFLTLPSA